MQQKNMLSAKRVKLHGMTSTKWTNEDKITQYKGLITLYTRDKKNLEMENAIQKTQLVQDTKSLQKMINVSRNALNNYEKGDKQKLRNTLAAHRRIQLAYQNSSLTSTIGMVDQVNFTKRKTRDMLKYKMKLKSEELIELKKKCSVYEDNVIFGSNQTLPSESHAFILIGKVEDAVLKQEAAVHIKNCYKAMIKLMEKDAIYFDAILQSVQKDGFRQAECLIAATKVGQVGMESVYQKNKAFRFLEFVVKQDTLRRMEDLVTLQHIIENYGKTFKDLVRLDSDINLGVIDLPEEPSMRVAKHELEALAEKLNYLKSIFFSSTIEHIFPCLKEQLNQKLRLVSLKEKYENRRDYMFEKAHQADLKLSQLKTTMVDTTVMYNSTKVEMRDKIDGEINKIKENQTLLDNRYQLMAQVRSCLKHLETLTNLLNWDSNISPRSRRRSSDRSAKTPRGQEEDYALRMIPELIGKFTRLATISDDIPMMANEPSYRLFEVLMRRGIKPMQKQKIGEDDLMENLFPDSRVPTYFDIKQQSADIVATGLAAKEIKPVPAPKKKKIKL